MPFHIRIQSCDTKPLFLSQIANLQISEMLCDVWNTDVKVAENQSNSRRHSPPLRMTKINRFVWSLKLPKLRRATPGQYFRIMIYWVLSVCLHFVPIVCQLSKSLYFLIFDREKRENSKNKQSHQINWILWTDFFRENSKNKQIHEKQKNQGTLNWIFNFFRENSKNKQNHQKGKSWKFWADLFFFLKITEFSKSIWLIWL